MSFLVGMFAVWWIWATHTLYANRFDTDNHHHRIATLTMMFLAAMMAAFCGGGLVEKFPKFAAYYIAIRVIQMGMY